MGKAFFINITIIIIVIYIQGDCGESKSKSLPNLQKPVDLIKERVVVLEKEAKVEKKTLFVQ